MGSNWVNEYIRSLRTSNYKRGVQKQVVHEVLVAVDIPRRQLKAGECDYHCVLIPKACRIEITWALNNI